MDDIKQCSYCYGNKIYLYAELKDGINNVHKKVWDCYDCHEKTTRQEEF